MFDLKKLFVRQVPDAEAQREAESDYPQQAQEGLERDYQDVIGAQFLRWGILPWVLEVEARKVGEAKDGLGIYVGMIRLVGWDRVSGLRLLIGLPMIEAKVRRNISRTWLADISHFGGLWLHASERMHLEAADELRQLLTELTLPGMESAPASLSELSD